ncbi:MAG: hypothetical protein ACO305_14340 [Rubrivivax sp.]
MRAVNASDGLKLSSQCFGSAADLNIHLHCLVLPGVYRFDADGRPTFIEAGEPLGDQI